ncbi:hypothetical protein AABB24_037270 [Solanum stoloniferum]|uniref:Transcription initiation factor TFIID subunit 9 n=1 Tax=Solanum stoloniferum TaxID=62892 RepID=A0ABD2R3Y7_9SOLN
MAEGGEEDLPRDAKIVKTLLKSMGVDDYEPRVVHQFLELWYRYVVDVLTDAQVYSEHVGKASIDSNDIKLAIQSKVNFSFSQPPPHEVSSLKFIASKSKEFVFWIELIVPSLPSAGYVSYVVCEQGFYPVRIQKIAAMGFPLS